MLAGIADLELVARMVVEGLVSGLHRSPFQGFSNEFAEHREYTPGDDLRYVDWKVFGKTDKYYLKQFEAETNLICYLLLDISESMQYQGPAAPLSKRAYGQCAAAALACAASAHSVSLVTFDMRLRGNIAAERQPTQLKQLLHVMEAASAVQARADFQLRAAPGVGSSSYQRLFDNMDARWPGSSTCHRRRDVIVLHLSDRVIFVSACPLFKGLGRWVT